jgi:hypothetical protein
MAHAERHRAERQPRSAAYVASVPSPPPTIMRDCDGFCTQRSSTIALTPFEHERSEPDSCHRHSCHRTADGLSDSFNLTLLKYRRSCTAVSECSGLCHTMRIASAAPCRILFFTWKHDMSPLRVPAYLRFDPTINRKDGVHRQSIVHCSHRCHRPSGTWRVCAMMTHCRESRTLAHSANTVAPMWTD